MCSAYSITVYPVIIISSCFSGRSKNRNSTGEFLVVLAL